MDWDKIDKIDNIMDNIYLIQKGVRSCYTETISGPDEMVIRQWVKQNRETQKEIVYGVYDQVNSIESIVKKEGLYFYAYTLTAQEEDPDSDWKTVAIWIYKYPHQGRVIKMLNNEHTFLEEWIIGKLLGYSDQAMEEFFNINDKGEI